MSAIASTEVDINGTSLQGYVHTNYAAIIATFGEPRFRHGDKTKAEWTLATPSGDATLYDWKTYGDVSAVTTWNIGGRSTAVVAEIVSQLRREGHSAY